MRRRLSRRALIHGAAASVLAGAARPAPASGARLLAQADDAGRDAMARAAQALLAALDASRRGKAARPYQDTERLNWHYVPRGREGLPFKDMPAAARAAAHELMKVSLSAAGYAKAVDITRLEDVLRQVEMLGLLRDPEKYYVTIFGAPGSSGPWGWRVEGHHLSLNFSLVPGRPVAVTPAFMGANPALVGGGPLKGLRVLQEEQDLGLALARSVDARLRPRLLLATSSLGDVVSGPGREETLRTPAGVPLADLSAEQREAALRLVAVYVRNMRSEVAERELTRVREAGVERLHFAWAGPIDPARPHYYRLHGPTVLIEYDNTQNDANHVHSVWHDPAGDFGKDPLRSHYLHGHDHA